MNTNMIEEPEITKKEEELVNDNTPPPPVPPPSLEDDLSPSLTKGILLTTV